LIAVLGDETDAPFYADALEAASSPKLSAANWLEFFLVADARRVGAEAEALLAAAGIEVVPVDLDQARLAREAYARYGKGNHPARLNFGDCFAYALAKASGEPLLFKGADFGRTDVASALG
jgi:ribonuclease VapC